MHTRHHALFVAGLVGSFMLLSVALTSGVQYHAQAFVVDLWDIIFPNIDTRESAMDMAATVAPAAQGGKVQTPIPAAPVQNPVATIAHCYAPDIESRFPAVGPQDLSQGLMAISNDACAVPLADGGDICGPGSVRMTGVDGTCSCEPLHRGVAIARCKAGVVPL